MKNTQSSFFWVCMVCSVILLGCGTTKGQFNNHYLPDAGTDKAVRQIRFTDAQNSTIKAYVNSPDETHDTALFWLSPEHIYLNLDGDKIFAITPDSQQIKILTPEEKVEISQTITQKAQLTNTVTEKGVISQLVGSLFAKSGQRYSGKIMVDEQRQIEVRLKTIQNREGTDIESSTCSSGELTGDLSLDNEKIFSIQWDFPCDWLPRSVSDIKVPQLMRRVQLSPSGQYLFYQNLLYNTAGEIQEKKLFWDYAYTISTAVSPDWTTLAILRGKSGQYWIELFDLHL